MSVWMSPVIAAASAFEYVGLTLGSVARTSWACVMFWYSCAHTLPLLAGVGKTPKGYSTVRASVLVKTDPSRAYPADTVVTKVVNSIRCAANIPVTAFWMPAGELGTDVGAVKNGTLLSLQATAAAAPSASPSVAARRVAARDRAERIRVIGIGVMLEAQVEAEVVALGRRVRGDVVAAPH